MPAGNTASRLYETWQPEPLNEVLVGTEGLEPSRLAALRFWWEVRDSNSYAFRRLILGQVCIPISPTSLA